VAVTDSLDPLKKGMIADRVLMPWITRTLGVSAQLARN
jgi:hypothetical protein